MKIKPTLFIVGAPKAGTTALHAYLEKHPQVSMSSDKEPNYFSWQEIESQQLYYKKINIKTEKEYISLFHPTANTKICGEGSVSYLYYPEVAQRIHTYQPEARIIISLRNPVTRAFSHYLMDYSLGLVSEQFETIYRNGANHPKTKHYFQQYFLVSDYAPQVKRYMDIFKKDQLHFLLHEDLVKNPTETLNKLSQFLEIDPRSGDEGIQQQNVTLAGKNKFIGTLYKNEFIRKFASQVVGDELKNKIKNLLFTKKALPRISDKFTEELRIHYLESNAQIAIYTGLDIRDWK